MVSLVLKRMTIKHISITLTPCVRLLALDLTRCFLTALLAQKGPP